MPNIDKQSIYVEKLEKKLVSLLMRNYKVYKFMHYFLDGETLGFIIFYKTQKELKYCEDLGINEAIKQIILNELRDMGYDKEFSMGIIKQYGYERNAIDFEFDSHENLLKNFAGSYMYRLHDGPNDLCIIK